MVSRFHLIALAATLSLSFPAAAAPARAVTKDADLGSKRSQAPDASLGGSIQARGKPAAVSGPTLDFETFRYRIEGQVSSKRHEELADLEKLIRLGGSPQEMPTWLFRVAELHWEESQYFFFEANRRDDAIAAAKGNPARQAQLRAEKKDLQDRSRAEQAAAIGRYKEIARRFPRYSRLDEVFFFLGENLWKQNRRGEALEVYKALITRYPKSKYVPDAWMAFGEHYFDSAEKGDRQANLLKALETYKRAAVHTESSVYGYALYKQGWVHYNLQHWNEALDLFKAVILFGELPTSTVAPDKKLALAREARKDYVRTYSHIGDPRAAPDDFARVGGKDSRDMLKGLAGLYFDEGKDKEAILVYHHMLKADPVALDAPFFQSRIITCAGRMGRKQLAVQQAARFVQMVREWEKRPGDENAKRVLADARKDAENTLRTLAVQYHNEFKKMKDEASAVYAAELYRLHLEAFPEAPQAYDMRFFHAELLYALAKFPEAGAQYTRVAEIDIKQIKERKKPGKYMVDSLESAVMAYDVVAKNAETKAGKKPAAGDGKTKLAIPKEKQQLIDACVRYLQYVPRGEKVVEATFKAAKVYYDHNHFPEAEKLFLEIALKHPKHELARYSANLAVDAYNLMGDPRGMNALAKRLYQDGELMRAQPALREDLSRVIEDSGLKLVEEFDKAGRYAEAADAYLAFARDWPNSKRAPTALFNASIALSKAGQVDRAMATREQLVARYPNDPLVPKVALANAQDREAVADFDRAADGYERYFAAWRKAAGTPGAPAKKKAGRAKKTIAARPVKGDGGGYEESKARDAIYNAGVLRQGLSQYRRAETDKRLFIETWPKAPETPKVFLSMADIYAREKAKGKELRHLEAYQQEYVRDPTEWLVIQGRIAKIHAKSGNKNAERKAYEQALAYWKARRSSVQERGLEVVAQARYLELEKDFQEYDRIDFAVPPRLSAQRQVSWLKSQVQVKGARLLQLQKKYTGVVEMKQADPAVCALYKIGLGYKRFAYRFESAPIPRELRHDKNLAQEYKAQLKQLAEAPEKKAIEALEYAMTKSRELGVTNACSQAATDILVKYKPDFYGPPIESIPQITPATVASKASGSGHGLMTKLYVPPKRVASASSQALPPLGAPVQAAPISGPAKVPDRDLDLPDDERPARPVSPARDEPLPPVGKDEDLLP